MTTGSQASVWLVMDATGSYDEYRDDPVRAFTTKADADLYVARLDEEQRRRFDGDVPELSYGSGLARGVHHYSVEQIPFGWYGVSPPGVFDDEAEGA